MADIERRISTEQEERLAGEWVEFSELRCKEPYFAPRREPALPEIDWPDVNINDCLDGIDMMIYQQLKGCSDVLAGNAGELLAVRPNYGTGIIPSMFGAEIFVMPRETNTLPCARPLPGGGEDVKRVIGNRRDYLKGLAGKAFDFAHRWLELIEPFEKIKRFVYMYNPDLQGPLPLVELMWGSDVYMDMYDDEAAVGEALDFFTDVIIEFCQKYKRLCPDFDIGHSVEWGLLHKGGVIIRNDAAMNISGEMYREFAMPRDQRIIDAFGGGMHFCGHGDHYIAHAAGIHGITTFNLSQPEMNDMEEIYKNTIDKGAIIIGMPAAEISRAVQTGRDLHGRVHCGASLAAWV